jgi:hypothetical protein
MTAKDAILFSLDQSDFIAKKYLDDLSDADLKVSPMDGINTIAWQLGHLISAERMFVEGVKPGTCPPLPEGFEAAHPRGGDKESDASKYFTKAAYLKAWETQRAATKKALSACSDSDLSQPGPEAWRSFCPTVGAVLQMTGEHVMMHVGQWVAVRRKVGKPVVI